MNREKQRGCEGHSGLKLQAKEERGQQQSGGKVNEDVARVESRSPPSEDPPLESIREQEQRAVGRAGAPRSAEVRRFEDLGDPMRRLDPGVIANDGLVVVSEKTPDPLT